MLEIAEIGPHQYFGELSLLRKRAHSASIVSNNPVEVLVLTKPDFNLHIEPRCGQSMLDFAEQTYKDNFHSDEDVSSICELISTAHHWSSFKERVLSDAISGRALNSHQHDALDPVVLESAGQSVAGSRLLHPSPRQQSLKQSPSPKVPSWNSSPRDRPTADRSPSAHMAHASPRGAMRGGVQLPLLMPPAITQTSPRLSPRLSLSLSPHGTGSLGSTPRRARIAMANQPKYSLRGAGMVGSPPIMPTAVRE